MHIKTRNTNYAIYQVYDYLQAYGVQQNSRNGPVLTLHEPLIITYTDPAERVNFNPVRHANPFFHLFEAMWMLAGRRDVAFPAQFAQQLKEYSDDGEIFNAAYGYRTRVHFDIDQFEVIITTLMTDPESRQAVLTLWDPHDLTKRTKDKACNMLLHFQIINRQLVMNVFNRSNDLIWGGVCGANIVHLVFFQEYLATHLNVFMGPVHVHSSNVHVYTDNPQWKALKQHVNETIQDGYKWKDDLYVNRVVQPERLITNTALFDEELAQWFEDPYNYHKPYHNMFITHTLVPMYNSWQEYKFDNFGQAKIWAHKIGASDWATAAQLWLKRTEENRNAK